MGDCTVQVFPNFSYYYYYHYYHYYYYYSVAEPFSPEKKIDIISN